MSRFEKREVTTDNIYRERIHGVAGANRGSEAERERERACSRLQMRVTL